VYKEIDVTSLAGQESCITCIYNRYHFR